MADFYGAFPGQHMESRDVEQAYIQAEMEGPPVYIMLPQELWTDAMHKMRCPVFRLEKALYGHKNSGNYWQRFCDQEVRKADFEPIAENWPSVYYNYKTHMFLIVYVDDMKLCGPSEHCEKTWAAISERIKLEVPKEARSDEQTFLGCTHRRVERVAPSGKSVTCIEADMRQSLRSAIAKYDTAVFEAEGVYPHLYNVDSPFIEEDTKTAPSRAPFNGEEFVECPSCLHTMPKSEAMGKCLFKAGTSRKLRDLRPMVSKETISKDKTSSFDSEDDGESTTAGSCSNASDTDCYTEDESGQWSDMEDDGFNWWSGINRYQGSWRPEAGHHPCGWGHCQSKPIGSTRIPAPSGKSGSKGTGQYDPNRRGAAEKLSPDGTGILQPMAAMMLMTLLYTARAARFDLLKPINFLAKRVTRWDLKCDRRLHRLMCWVHTSVEHMMVGWIGDSPSDITAHLFCDADFAGCPYTLRSTSGHHADLQGPNTRFPWAAASKGHTSRAESTPEAELVSAAQGMKNIGEPALQVLSVLLSRFHANDWVLCMYLHEDNSTTVTIAMSGKTLL